MSTVGFILSLTTVLSLIGIGFCIWDVAKKEEGTAHGLSYAGIIAGTALTVTMIISIVLAYV